MLARVEFEGEERARARLRAGQGRAVRHRAFRVLGAAGDGARAADPADRRAGARARQPAARTAARSASASAPATRSIYRQRHDPAGDAHAAGRAGRGGADRSAHHEPRRDLRRLLRAARPRRRRRSRRWRCEPARRWCRCSRCRSAAGAIGWFTSIRSSRRAPTRADAVREFTQRCTDVLEMYVRRQPELWLWMHRRWRDNGAVADSVPGLFPRAASEKSRSSARRVVVCARCKS